MESSYYSAEFIEYSSSKPDFEFSSEGSSSRAIRVLVSPFGGATWVASFAAPDPGMRAISGLFSAPSPTELCVIERGTAFIGDVQYPKTFREVHTYGPVTSARNRASPSILLLLTPWSISCIDLNGVKWSTARIAIDGFRIDEIRSDKLVGLADPDDESREFSVDLASGSVFGGCGFE